MLEKMLDLKNTFEGKFLAVLMSVVLVMSMTNILAFAGNEGQKDGSKTESAPTDQVVGESDKEAVGEAVQHGESAAAKDADASKTTPSQPLVSTTVDEAVVTFETQNAFVSVKDQLLSGTMLTTELHKELRFTASADTGFELGAITAKNAANADVPVTTQDGVSSIAAEYVDSTLVVSVVAAAVVSDEPEVETTPITSDTKIEPGEADEKGEPEEPKSEEPETDDPEAPVADEDVVEVEADVSNPAFEGYAQAGNVLVKVTAAEGVLPEGATVQATRVERQDIVDAVAERVESQGKVLEDAIAIDVTLLDKDGNEIQPNGALNVCFFDANVEGEEVGVYRVSDDASQVETIGARQADPAVQSFDVDHFTIYVVGTSTKAESSVKAYEVAPGGTVDLFSDNRNADYGSWAIVSGGDIAYIVSSGNPLSNPFASVAISKDAQPGSKVRVKYSYSQYFYITVGKAVATQEVSFDVNGGQGSVPSGIAATTGSQIVLPGAELTREGYRFAGWSRDGYANDAGHYTSQVYAPGDTFTMPEYAVTLYAVWAKTNLNADFYIRLNGSIPDEPSTHAPSGYSKAIHKLGAVKTGQFVSDPTGAAVSANLNVDAIPTDNEIKEALKWESISYDPATQYVVWYVMKYEGGHKDDAWNIDGVLLSKDKINLTYHMNAPSGTVVGTFPVGGQYYVGDKVAVAQNDVFSREGYTFKEWNTLADGTGNAYQPGSTFAIEGNTELYAIWVPNDGVPYTIADYLQQPNGQWLDAPTFTYEQSGTTDAAVYAGSKTYSDYTFDESNEGNVLSGVVKADGSLILKRYYKANSSQQFNVFYYSKHNDVGEWNKLAQSGSIETPIYARTFSEVTQAGYGDHGNQIRVVGWTTDPSMDGVNNALGKPGAYEEVSKDPSFVAFGEPILYDGESPVKLYAIWAKNKDIESEMFGIAYDAGLAGSAVSGMPDRENNVLVGEYRSVTTQTPTWSGHIFIGWTVEPSDIPVEPGKLFAMPKQDVTFTAQWAPVSELSIIGDHLDKTYTGELHKFDDFNVNGLDQSLYEILGIMVTPAEGTNIGNYEGHIDYANMKIVEKSSGLDVTNHFSVGKVVAPSLTVKERMLTNIGETASRTYNGNEQEITGFKTTGLIENHVLSGLSYSAKGTDIGKYKGVFSGTPVIRDAKGADVTNNYNIVNTPGWMKVDPTDAEVVVTVTGRTDTKVYDGTAHTASGYDVSIPEGSLYTEADFSFGGDATATRTDVGTTNMGLAADQFVNNNGNFTNVVFNVTDGWMKVDPTTLTIKASDSGKIYGQDDPELTASIEGLKGADEFTGTYEVAREAGESVGVYEIAARNVVFDNPNYTIETKPGTFVITQLGEAAIVVGDLTKTYDGVPLEPSAVTPVGLAVGDYVDGIVYEGAQTDVGGSEATVASYVIRNAEGVDVTASYVNIQVVPGSLVVNPATITVTANNQTKIAGETDPELTYTFAGAVNDEIARFAGGLQREAGEEAGVYAINQGDLVLVDNGAFRIANYTLEFASGTFTITAAPVTPPTPPTPPTSPTPTPLPTPGTVPPDSPIAPVVTPIVDALQGAAEAVIGDNDTPLASHDHASCWVHWYIILGIIVTALYGACVALRRGLFSRKLKKYEDGLTGGGDPAPGAPSIGDDASAPIAPKGAPAGATLAAGLGE